LSGEGVVENGLADLSDAGDVNPAGYLIFGI
jgi:hypothetical protein